MLQGRGYSLCVISPAPLREKPHSWKCYAVPNPPFFGRRLVSPYYTDTCKITPETPSPDCAVVLVQCSYRRFKVDLESSVTSTKVKIQTLNHKFLKENV